MDSPRPTYRPIQPRAERAPGGHLVADPEIERMRVEDRARDEALRPFSEGSKQRWKMYVLGAVIFFPLVTWFFTPAGFQSLWFQLLVSAAYGTFVALYRPTGYTATISTLLAGLSIQAWTGHASIGFGLMMSLIFYGFIGTLVGIGETNRMLDGR